MMYPVLAAVAALLPISARAAAIIGDGDVVLGVSDFGALGAPYVGNVAGLPANDPIDRFDLLRLRGPGGAFGYLYSEGWGVAIRDGSGAVMDECEASTRTSSGSTTAVTVDRFTGSDGDDEATSRVICGAQEALRVQHRFTSASRVPGCEGAYQIKVTIKNLACGPIENIAYRRINDPDVGGSTSGNIFTIQGRVGSGDPLLEVLSNDLFCDHLPSSSCPPLPNFPAPPYVGQRNRDQGSVFQYDLGGLAAGESMTFRMYYGVFDDFADASACIDGGKMSNWMVARQTGSVRTHYLYGIRRGGPHRFDSDIPDECVNLGMNEAPVARFAFAAFSAAPADIGGIPMAPPVTPEEAAEEKESFMAGRR